MSVTVGAAEIAAAKYAAKAYIDQQGVEGAARPYIESLVTAYEAVRKATGNHVVSLYVAAQEVLVSARERPIRGTYVVPQNARAVLEGVQRTPGHVLGYCAMLRSALERNVREGNGPDIVSVGSRRYVLKIPSAKPFLVGLEKEQQELHGYVRQLFAYDKEALMNPDKGRFPFVILYTGPPGTGKSTLLQDAQALGTSLSQRTGMPFHMQYFGAADFSKWLGGSSRALKKVIDNVYNPGGVGIFAIEDIDMLLVDRDESESKGILHVQQHLMNVLSGNAAPQLGNVLHLFTTNRPASLDEALTSRMVERRYINPFQDVSAHRAYLQHAFPLLPKQTLSSLAQLSLAATFTGRDLCAIVTRALAATTRPPTVEELTDKSFDHTKRYGTVTVELLETLIAERREFQRS